MSTEKGKYSLHLRKMMEKIYPHPSLDSSPKKVVPERERPEEVMVIDYRPLSMLCKAGFSMN